MFRLSLLVAISACACMASIVSADVTVSQDSDSFTYNYEMNVNPSTQDLDNNTVVDFFDGVASGFLIPQTYAGGLAISDQAFGETLFRTDFGDSITRATLVDADTPWTWEVSVKKDTSTTQGSVGWFGVAMQNPTATHSIRVDMADDRVSYHDQANLSEVEFLVGTNFADDQFHTIRVAYEGNDSYFIWIDDILLNDDLTTASGFAGINGSFNTNGSVFVGDFSFSLDGDWSVDFLRYQDGTASAPLSGGGTVVVSADSLMVTRGTFSSGGLAELEFSDNVDLAIQRSSSDIQSRTEFVVQGTSPTDSPLSMEITLEGAVVSRSTVNQTIELFDYRASAWEEVDSDTAMRFTDATVVVQVGGDLTRFVEAGTNSMEARIGYQSPNPRQQFGSFTDQFIWTIGQ